MWKGSWAIYQAVLACSIYGSYFISSTNPKIWGRLGEVAWVLRLSYQIRGACKSSWRHPNFSQDLRALHFLFSFPEQNVFLNFTHAVMNAQIATDSSFFFKKKSIHFLTRSHVLTPRWGHANHVTPILQKLHWLPVSFPANSKCWPSWLLKPYVGCGQSTWWTAFPTTNLLGHWDHGDRGLPQADKHWE